MIFSRKNTLKDDISSITEKDDIHPRKYGISLDRKVKDDKKVYFDKKVLMIPCFFMEIDSLYLTGVFMYCFPMEKNQET